MATQLSLSTDPRDDGTLVLRAVGELDMSNIDAFSDALTDAVTAAEGATVTVDLGDVGYLDSGAINALFDHTEHIQLVVNHSLMPVLRISGLVNEVGVHVAGPRSAD